MVFPELHTNNLTLDLHCWHGHGNRQRVSITSFLSPLDHHRALTSRLWINLSLFTWCCLCYMLFIILNKYFFLFGFGLYLHVFVFNVDNNRLWLSLHFMASGWQQLNGDLLRFLASGLATMGSAFFSCVGIFVGNTKLQTIPKIYRGQNGVLMTNAFI